MKQIRNIAQGPSFCGVRVLHRAPCKRFFSAGQALAKQWTLSADSKSREKAEIPAPSCFPAKLSPQDAGME